MWIWWIVSLTVLIACFIFAYRMMVSSYDFLPMDKKFSFGFKKDFSSQNPAPAQQEVIRSLKTKLQAVEDNTSFYEIQFSKFQQRLKILEEQYNTQVQQANHPHHAEEDWKEMYFEENEVKEKLENELDETRQKLEAAEHKLSSIGEDNSKWRALQSDYDSRLNDLQSMQNNIGLLQRQLEASGEREKELEQILLSEISIKKKYAQLETQFISLKSENEDLRRQLLETNEKERDLQIRIERLNELISKMRLFMKKKKQNDA